MLWMSRRQTEQLTTEADLITPQGAQCVNRVRLHQVLGGSYDALPAREGGCDAPFPTEEIDRVVDQLSR
jgi:hypothetical protein